MSNTTTPAWASKLSEQFQNSIAHCFLLHLNIDDYVVPGARLNSYITQALASRDIIAFYDIAHGIEFALPSMANKARAILGLDKPNNTNLDPGLAALIEVGGAPKQEEWPRQPGEAIPMLEQLLKSNDGTIVLVINHAEMIVPDGPKATMPPGDRALLVMLEKWGTDQVLERSGHMILLTTRSLSDIHGDLRAASTKYEAIEIPLPSLEQRTDYIERYIAKNQVALDAGLSPQMLANMTAGLSLVHIEDVFLNAITAGTLRQEMVVERKRAIMQSEFADVIETIDSRATFADIGGLARIKKFFQKRVIRPLREGDTRRAPMGVLMTGPAGTGKSLMAQAVANESGYNFVVLRLGGKIASMWQGEGERKLMKALSAIMSLTPAIVFIDEIDQVVQRGDGSGNQQNSRMFQILLEFMSDTSHRGQICFLAATNRPDLLDAALKRPGRFDKKIPFLIPDAPERADIISVMAAKYMGKAMKASPELIAGTEGWTGAEIEACALKAEELLYDEEVTNPLAAFYEASKRLKPSTAQIEFMTKLAIAECNDLDLLPPQYRELLDNRAKLEQEIADSPIRERGETRRKGLS